MKFKRFESYAWGVTAWNLAVVLWGAYVRASGSGAGCGSHWPLCNGGVLPRAPESQTVIEFTHRLMSGLALLLVVGLVVWAFRAFSKKHPARRGAVLSLVFIVSEALIGAGLVLLRLVGQKASTARALYMSVHLVNTFMLLAVLALTAWWASGGRTVRWRGHGAVSLLLALSLLGTLVIAVSGAVAALGDTLFPANSFAAGLSQDFSPTAHLLLRLRVFHPLIAIAIGCLVIAAAALANSRRPDVWTKRL
ncbi:MAG TPA: COX15/CtaA family protein, partial [Pyrinomonadaceae bacterium]